MKTKLTSCVRALSLVVLGASLAGCEDSGVIPPSDASIVLTASPSTVKLDPDAPGATDPLTGTSTITAVVFDKGGFPQQNITLLFAASAGEIVSEADNCIPACNPVRSAKTNSSGMARVVLRISETDPGSIKVTASSSLLVKDVTVTKVVLLSCIGNQAPFAVIANTDPIAGSLGTSGSAAVLLDGRTSTDDLNDITDYAWSCGNGSQANGSRATCTYTSAGIFTATLSVTDGCGEPSAADDTVTINIAP